MERSNLGFLRTLTFFMVTLSRGKILEHSLVICSLMVFLVLKKKYN